MAVSIPFIRHRMRNKTPSSSSVKPKKKPVKQRTQLQNNPAGNCQACSTNCSCHSGEWCDRYFSSLSHSQATPDSDPRRSRVIIATRVRGGRPRVWTIMTKKTEAMIATTHTYSSICDEKKSPKTVGASGAGVNTGASSCMLPQASLARRRVRLNGLKSITF